MTGINKIQNYNEILIAMVSMFFSSLIVNVIMKKGVDFDYLIVTMQDIKRTLDIPVISSYFLVLIKRIKQLVIIILLMKFFKPEIIFNLFIVLISSFYGIIMSVQAYYGGVYSVGIFLISIFPQYILYFLSVDFTYKFYKGRVFNKNKIKFISAVFMLTAIGTFFEENFLRIFLK